MNNLVRIETLVCGCLQECMCVCVGGGGGGEGGRGGWVGERWREEEGRSQYVWEDVCGWGGVETGDRMLGRGCGWGEEEEEKERSRPV